MHLLLTVPCRSCCRCRCPICRRQVEGVKDAMNTAAAGGSAARRIAGEVGREYILHKDAPEREETDGQPAAAGEEAAAVPAEPQQRQQSQGAQQGAAGAVAAVGASASAGAAAAAAAAGAGGAPAAAEVLEICFDVELGASDASEWQHQRCLLSNAL